LKAWQRRESSTTALVKTWMSPSGIVQSAIFTDEMILLSSKDKPQLLQFGSAEHYVNALVAICLELMLYALDATISASSPPLPSSSSKCQD
jgi:hypothetical protein